MRNFLASKKGSKRMVPLIIVVVCLLLFGYFFAYRPYSRIKAKGMIVVASAKELKAEIAKNDIDSLQKKLNEFDSKYQDFEKAAKSVYWASFIPYISDFKHGVTAGDYMITAAQDSVKAIAPYADLIGFKKGQTSFVERSSEERLQTAIATLDKVLAKIDPISANVDKATQEINKINPNRYPEKIGKREVRAQVSQIKEQFIGLSSLFVNAKPLLKNLPVIFGQDEEKKYLLLFQNIYERRASGGFLTSYAVLKINKGKLTIENSEDIYSLDNSIGSHPVAPPEILTYHKGVSQFYIRDSNLSPDFVQSIKLFNSLYDKSSVKIDYDGIIALDSKVLVDMLTIFGDTEADGIVFSANKDERCDCPQAIYKLFDMVDRPVGYVKENRKGVLGDLMYELFYKAIGFSPSKYWGTLAQTMFKNLDEKHILLFFTEAPIQSSVEKLNYAGRIQPYDGDYLHVNNVNFAGAKSNLFVTEEILSEAKVTGGQIQKTVTVDYKNPYPGSDCNLERGGLCLNATLRNWIRVYVPKGSKLVDFKGSIMPVKTYDDLGKTVFEGFLTVDPLGKAKVIVTYTLPSTVSSKDYHILFQKQPGVISDRQKITVKFNGKQLYSGNFDVDKTLKQ